MEERKRNKYIAAIFGVTFAMVGLLFITSVWVMYARGSSLEKTGRRVTGQVIDTLIMKDSAEGNEYISVYQFTTPDGQTIKSQTVSNNRKPWPQKGEDITIVYDEANPQHNFPEGHGMAGVGATVFMTIIGSILGGFGILLLCSAFTRRHVSPP